MHLRTLAFPTLPPSPSPSPRAHSKTPQLVSNFPINAISKSFAQKLARPHAFRSARLFLIYPFPSRTWKCRCSPRCSRSYRSSTSSWATRTCFRTPTAFQWTPSLFSPRARRSTTSLGPLTLTPPTRPRRPSTRPLRSHTSRSASSAWPTSSAASATSTRATISCSWPIRPTSTRSLSTSFPRCATTTTMARCHATRSRWATASRARASSASRARATCSHFRSKSRYLRTTGRKFSTLLRITPTSSLCSCCPFPAASPSATTRCIRWKKLTSWRRKPSCGTRVSTFQSWASGTCGRFMSGKWQSPSRRKRIAKIARVKKCSRFNPQT